MKLNDPTHCRDAVANEDTISGYWVWLLHKLTEDDPAP